MSIEKCPACGTPYKSSASKFCSECGAGRPIPQPNPCTNPDCDNYNVDLGEKVRYCDLCGTPTPYGKKITELIGP